MVGLLVAPTTTLTALLYYFGWARTAALYGYFGVDQSTLQLSTADYLLRSADVAFRPLAALLLVVGGWTWLYAVLGSDRATGRYQRTRNWVRAGLPWSAAVLVGGPVVDLLVVPLPLMPPLAAAVLLGTGALLADLTLRLAADDHATPDPFAAGSFRWLTRVVLAATAALALFWSTTVYATAIGHSLAANIGARPSSRPGVTVYCTQRPQITGPGVTVAALPGDNLRYRYQYDGLVLLAHPGPIWLLLPIAWTRHDAVIRLPDDQSCRVDLRPPHPIP